MKIINPKKSLLLGALVAFVFVLIVGGGKSVRAYTHQQWCGNWAGNLCHGYFHGDDASGHNGYNLISDGLYVNSASQMINKVRNALNDGGRNRMGASMLIDEMMGYGHNLRSADTNAFNNWADLVRAYDNAPAGSGYGVYWSKNANPDRNSAYVSESQGRSPADGGNGGPFRDDVYHVNMDGKISVIKFYYPRGSFKIQRSCANLLGDTSLPTPKDNSNWKIKATSSVNHSTRQPGQSVVWTHKVRNAGSVKSPTISGYVNWGGGAAAGPIPSSYISTGHRVRPAREYSQKFNPGQSKTLTYNFTIPTGAEDGDRYCQRVNGDPTAYDDSSGFSSSYACVTIEVPAIVCPMLPGVDTSAVRASFGSGNDGETTYSPYGGSDKHNPPSSPKPGDNKYVREANYYTIVSASDDNGAGTLPVDTGNNTVDFTKSIKRYPYDSNKASVRYTDHYDIKTYKYKLDADGRGYWDYDRTTTNHTSEVFSNGEASIGECYHRFFTAKIISTNGNLRPNNEDPTSAKFGADAEVTFKEDPSNPPYVGLREPNKVTLSTSTSPRSNVSSCGISSGSSLTFTSSSFGSTGRQTFSATCDTGVPPLQVGDTACANMTLQPTKGKIDDAGNSSGTSGSETQSACTGPLTNNPYVHFFGNDVSAGGAFADSGGACTSGTTNGSIKTNTEGLAEGHPVRGSGGQFASIALGDILGYGSASLRNSGNDPTSTKGLMFSNTDPGNGHLGTSPCIPDYYGVRPASDVNKTDPGTGHHTIVDVNHSGNIGAMNVSPNTSEAIYVNGNATITGNITYDGAGSWNSISDIPSLYIIASGNINISPGVTRLDGTYIAQDNTIDTCSPHASFSGCNRQLSVFGSFIANRIELYRSFSSLRNSDAGEYPNPLNNAAAAAGDNCKKGDNANPSALNNPARADTTYDCAAEVMIFSPETYLVNPAIPPINEQIRFDAISSLSPVL